MPEKQIKEENKYFPESVRTRKVFRNLILHLHPVKIRRAGIKFNHTWGLGGMVALLFVFQVFTGLILRFAYLPVVDHAYESVLQINRMVFSGQFIRNIHHWSGMLMVILTFLHLLRVFYTQAFHTPRRSNWMIGVVLFILVIFSNFSGYLLPWDQLSFWAVTVMTSMLEYIPWFGDWLAQLIRGGSDVGPVTLLNFYTFHTALLPMAIVILMAFHFWKVRKAGGVVIPGGKANPDKEFVNTIPNLVLKELVVALVLMGFILLLAVFFNAPLLEKANPALSPNPAKAPWYFLGIQELLMHFHPFFAAIIIPFLFIGLLFWLPYSRFDNSHPGIWFVSEKGRKLSFKVLLFTIVMVPVLVLSNEFLPDLIGSASGWQAIILEGLLPFLVILIVLWGWIMVLYKKKGYHKDEIVQAVFTFLVISYLTLMIIGIWFRGEGMALMWPWEV